jgi:hypothetical protein
MRPGGLEKAPLFLLPCGRRHARAAELAAASPPPRTPPPSRLAAASPTAADDDDDADVAALAAVVNPTSAVGTATAADASLCRRRRRPCYPRSRQPLPSPSPSPPPLTPQPTPCSHLSPTHRTVATTFHSTHSATPRGSPCDMLPGISARAGSTTIDVAGTGSSRSRAPRKHTHLFTV